MKKLLIGLILTALAFGQVLFAASAASAATSPAQQPALPSSISGTIVNETNKTIEVKSGQTGESIVLNLGEVPRVVDCVSGQAASLRDRKDDHVIAYYGPAVAQSMPPQSNALAVICNIPQDAAAPHYAQVEAVEKSNDGNSIKVTIDNGSTIVTINRDAPIYPYLTRNIVTIDNVNVGSQLLMWYPLVALSYPAQATATQTVILGQAAQTALSDWLTVDNKEMTDAAHSISGTLPLFSSNAAADMVKQLNDKVNALSSEARQTAATDKNTSVYFSYDLITTPQYTSVVIHTSINPGNTSSDQATTLVLNTMTAKDGAPYHLYTLTDLLGPNALKLANGVIAKSINAAAPASYFTGDNGFKGLQSEPSFYVDENNNLTIIFDKYAIAPGVMGTPTFTIPLDNVVNITLSAGDTLKANGSVLVPLRQVVTALGFKAAWNGSLKTVTLTNGEQTGTIKIGSTAFNGTTLAAAPVIHNGLTYIPVGLVELGLGGCYQVNPANGAVTISAVK